MAEREIFTAPDGVEHVRSTVESATVCVLPRTPGLSPVYLRRCTAEHVVKLAARKERRLERRVARLKK